MVKVSPHTYVREYVRQTFFFSWPLFAYYLYYYYYNFSKLSDDLQHCHSTNVVGHVCVMRDFD